MRRGVLVAVAALLTVAAIFGVLLFFSARDDSTIGGEQADAPGSPDPALTSDTLRRGNVVLRFSDPAHAAALRELAAEFGPRSLEAQGQAVLVQRDEGAEGVVGEAYRRRLEASGPDDPALRQFAEYWLGRGE